MITAQDEREFTTGGCLVLAELISEQTGWPICSLTTYDFPEGPDVHAFVKTPDGMYLDVEGKHDEDEMFSRWSTWGPGEIYEYDVSDFDEDWFCQNDVFAIAHYVDRAKEIVPELIAMA